MNKPFSQACENNKDPILSVLKRVFVNPCEVLEIGSGTGQHAVYFAEHLPHVTWQPSDLAIYLPGIDSWLEEARLENIKSPMLLDINQKPVLGQKGWDPCYFRKPVRRVCSFVIFIINDATIKLPTCQIKPCLSSRK